MNIHPTVDCVEMSYGMKCSKKRFGCFAALCLCFLSIAYLSTYNHQQSSADYHEISDSLPILNQTFPISYNQTNHHSFNYSSLNKASQEMYGCIIFITNKGDINQTFSATLLYQQSGHNSTCDNMDIISTPNIYTLMCDLQSIQIANTTFMVSIGNCNDMDTKCKYHLEFEYLEIKSLTQYTKYEISVLPYIERMHYFKYLQSDSSIKSIDITLSDDDNCDQFSQCIYAIHVQQSIDSFPSMDNYDTFTCGQSMQTLSISTSDSKDYLLFGVNLNLSMTDPNDFDEINAGIYVTLFYRVTDDIKFIAMMMVAIFSIPLYCLCMIIWPKTRVWYKRYRVERTKKKYLNGWNTFYYGRYNILLEMFMEKGIADLIQSYLEDLDEIPELNDELIFNEWYDAGSTSLKIIGVKEPLLVLTDYPSQNHTQTLHNNSPQSVSIIN